jgi:hypothetical protein
MNREKLNDVESLCHSLFQNPNNLDLLHASFYDHLLKLPRFDGLRLSTSRQIIGSGGVVSSSGGDILRMTNNALKLRQLVDYDSGNSTQSDSAIGMRSDVQVMTTYMSQWVLDPYGTTLAVVDFVFGDDMPSYRKHMIAKGYRDKYETKSSNPDEQHVTSNKDFVRDQKKELMDLLKSDPVLSPLLNEMQKQLVTSST